MKQTDKNVRCELCGTTIKAPNKVHRIGAVKVCSACYVEKLIGPKTEPVYKVLVFPVKVSALDTEKIELPLPKIVCL